MGSGSAALPALRDGLRRGKPMVRRMCASILDHLVDEASVPDLVAALDDDDPDVCRRVLHALACDQCKHDGCRVGDDLFVPRALDMIRSHPDADVRAAAIDAVGRAARRRPEVVEFLAAAVEHEPNRHLRSMAGRRIDVAHRAARRRASIGSTARK